MKNPKKPGWWDEFVAFAIKGNAMALAVGTIIGAAFSTITKSITDDIIMPIVAIFMGGIDFSELKITLPRLFGEAPVDEAGNVIANTLNYGNFIAAVINFLILALVVFFHSTRQPSTVVMSAGSHSRCCQMYCMSNSIGLD